jgi:cyclic pyranopterin phosphate synthase
MQSCRAATIVERIRGQGERVHIPIGAVCNNNCLFCMEEDRASRMKAAAHMTTEQVRRILEQHRGAQELCFTSGEPTTRADLLQFIRWACELGYARVSLMTNGRRLAYAPYAHALLQAGLNRVYVSIHGDSCLLHEGLTRTPGSFDQTLQGIGNIARMRSRGVELNTSTVLTRRNVARQTDIYQVLRASGVDQVVFNALQLNGRAARHFDQLVPRYHDARAGFERLIATSADKGNEAFLVDVPMCITEGLPDRNRGFVERHLHYEADRTADLGRAELDPLRAVHTTDLDSEFRSYGEPCSDCQRRGACPGVYLRYVQQFGWGEFHAVQR